MSYWLFKSEPNVWSWDDQKNAGKSEEWDGVRNHQAQKNMMMMKIGDLGFFYHSVKEKCIVGIVEITAQAHPDSTNPEWHCVDVIARRDVPNPPTLAEIKAHPDLGTMVLVKQARLSVQPVSETEWHIICQMGNLDPIPRAQS